MSRSSPPKAPVLLVQALRPLPLMPLQPVLALCLRIVTKHHPRLFDRLGAHAEKCFGLDTTDLPFAFVLTPRSHRPRIVAVRRLPAQLDARIAGPMSALLGLVAGAYDGDALVFSRDLIVEGDMEAVLALRNAIDDAEIDIVRDLASILGPLGQRLAASFDDRRKKRAGKRSTPFQTAGRAWS